jgi:pimeloyl-ACP methyl ester carboxylesterase
MKVKTNGIEVNVLDRGKGEPALVFLHYWGGSSRTWKEVIEQLEGYRSIAIDHRGWGDSDAPPLGYHLKDLASDAQGVINTLRLKQFVLVGHSMGGKAAQLLASRQPTGLKGLVLVAPSPPTPTIPGDEQREAMLHAYDSRESVVFTRDNILTALPLSEEQKERVIEDSLRGEAVAKRAWPTQIMPEDISAQARLIKVPTLVIAGEKDKVDPVLRLQAEVIPLIQGSRLKVVPGAGHLSMLEAPGPVADLIRQFVSKL